MSNFKNFFSFEWRRFLNKRNLTLFLALLIISHGLLKVGINSYRDSIAKKNKFLTLEAVSHKKFKSYQFMGLEGINTIFVPGATSVFFKNTPVTDDLTANYNSVVRLKISDNFKSKSLFRGNLSGPFGVSDILVLLLSLIALFFGYDTLRDKEYLRFLSSFLSRRKIFFNLALTRFIILAFFYIVLFATLLFSLFLHNVHLSLGDYTCLTGWLCVTILMLLFFFLCGMITGIKTRSTGGTITAILSTWIFFIFLVPGAVTTIIEKNAVQSTRDYQTEIEKMNIIKEFELWAEKEYGSTFNKSNMDLARKIIEEFSSVYYNKIERFEANLKREIKINTDNYKIVSLFTPVTFYYLAANEVSGKGHRSFIDYYDYLQHMKRKFVRFWIDRVYYHDPKEIVRFIESDENIFRGKAQLPGHFLSGIIITVLIIIGLFMASYSIFVTFIAGLDKKYDPKLNRLEKNLKKGKTAVCLTSAAEVKDFSYNRYCAKETAPEFLKDEGESAEESYNRYIYVCHPDHLPGDTRAKYFVRFFYNLVNIPVEQKEELFKNFRHEDLKKQHFSEIPYKEKTNLLFSVFEVIHPGIVIIDELERNVLETETKFLVDRITNLKKQNFTILYFTRSITFGSKIYDGDFIVPAPVKVSVK